MITRLDKKLMGSISGYHFAVLETSATDPVDGTIIFKRQIVIKDGNKITIEGGITDLASYVHPYDKNWTRKKDPTQQELTDVCQALNFFLLCGIHRLSDIDTEMVAKFFDSY